MNRSKRCQASGSNPGSFFGLGFAMTDYYVTLSDGGEPKIDFRLRGGPIDDFQAHQQLFAAIGHAAMSWARFETHLDAILIHVNASTHSETIYNPEHPVTFNAKVKLLKRWFNQHPSLENLADPIRKITSRSKELSQMRNRFLHFILEEWDAPNECAKFHGLKWMGNDEFRAENVRIGIEGLYQFSSIVNAGNRWLEDISRALFTREALEQLRKSAPRTRHLTRLFRRLRARLGF
jgi:hypothetical protein